MHLTGRKHRGTHQLSHPRRFPLPPPPQCILVHSPNTGANGGKQFHPALNPLPMPFSAVGHSPQSTSCLLTQLDRPSAATLRLLADTLSHTRKPLLGYNPSQLTQTHLLWGRTPAGWSVALLPGTRIHTHTHKPVPTNPSPHTRSGATGTQCDTVTLSILPPRAQRGLAGAPKSETPACCPQHTPPNRDTATHGQPQGAHTSLLPPPSTHPLHMGFSAVPQL